MALKLLSIKSSTIHALEVDMADRSEVDEKDTKSASGTQRAVHNGGFPAMLDADM
jgi:hypothetical protein